MSLIVFNQGAQSEKITFPSSQTFDFILATGEQTVWKWSDGRLFAQSLRTITISPDKPLTYQTVYHPVTAKPILEEGLYQLVGVWTTMGKTYSSVPLTIEIRK